MMVRAQIRTLVLAVSALAILGANSRAGFVLTVEKPGIQASQVSGVITETFSSITAGKYTTLTTEIGKVISPGIAVLPADAYGGAKGSGRYAAIGAQSGSVTATLSTGADQSYFGFWWSAADSQNLIEFLSGGKLVATFDPTAALGALGQAYYGNPNGLVNGGEKYAYLNVFADGGSVFDQVRFTNLNQGSGFETDNWSIRSAPFTTPYSGTTISGGVSGIVPEPSSLAMAAVGAVGLAVLQARRHRRAG